MDCEWDVITYQEVSTFKLEQEERGAKRYNSEEKSKSHGREILFLKK